MNDTASEDTIRIESLQLGPYGTNAYIVVCRQTGESLVVDAPAAADIIIGKLQGTTPRYILLTHDHPDHVGALAELRARLKVPLAAHTADSFTLEKPPEILLNDADTINLRDIDIAVLHTPGHTPGSLCFKLGRHLFSGDTVFPGGPGKTWSPDDFRQIIDSITRKILPLPGDTLVYPGHGAGTTVKMVNAEYAVFASRSHRPDLCGDVLWLSD